jgi:threonine dehydratase
MKEFWSYKRMQKIPENFRLTLNEGKTPIRQLKYEGLKVVIKDENENPNKSFKDRSLAYQVSRRVWEGKTKFVISSSGNAAVSAAAYCGLAKVELDIFISDHINTLKLERIKNFESEKIHFHQSQKAKSDAIKFASETGAFNLRGSHDDYALIGYETIAYELAEQYPDIDSIFLPTSSGTSAIGIYNGFKHVKKNVKIFICQTSRIHAMASKFDKDFIPSASSYADAIVDRVALRKTKITEIVKESEGGGFVVNDALLYQAKEAAESQSLYYTYNSLLGLAGLIKATQKSHELLYPVVLASGL